MIHHIKLQDKEVFEAVCRETSQNFRAFRAQQGAATDALYEDMVATEDDYAALTSRLGILIPSIYQDIRGYSPEYFVSSDAFGFAIDVKDCNAGERLVPMFSSVVVDMLLAWWYGVRMPQLAQKYTASAAETMSAIRTIVIPTFGTRKLRFF